MSRHLFSLSLSLSVTHTHKQTHTLLSFLTIKYNTLPFVLSPVDIFIISFSLFLSVTQTNTPTHTLSTSITIIHNFAGTEHYSFSSLFISQLWMFLSFHPLSFSLSLTHKHTHKHTHKNTNTLFSFLSRYYNFYSPVDIFIISFMAPNRVAAV